MHNLQKLKSYHLKQLIVFAKESKVTCPSESVFFHFDILELQQFYGHVCNFIWKTYNTT